MRLKSEGIHTTEVDGQTVILDTATSRYLTVNAEGTTLVEALRTEQTLERLSDVLVSEFQIDPDRALVDSRVFADKLRELGLLIE